MPDHGVPPKKHLSQTNLVRSFISGFKKCSAEAKSRGYGSILRLFLCVPCELDRLWRYRDFCWNRNWGSSLVDGHPDFAVLLPIPLLAFIVLGPTMGWRGAGSLAILGALLALYGIGVRWFRRSAKLIWFQLAVVGLAGALTWFCAHPASIEAGSALYRHGYIPLVLLLVVLPAAVARIVARLLFQRPVQHYGPMFAAMLRRVELFESPRYPEISRGDVGRAIFMVAINYPLQLLFWPSLVTLLVPSWYREYLLVWACLAMFATWLVLTLTGIHERFSALLRLLQRVFFIGGQLVLSLAVIILAAGRLFHVSYIETIVESSSGIILALFIAAAYCALWFYEYWINCSLCEAMLDLLGSQQKTPGRIAYPIDADCAKTAVAPEGRFIQIHGGARFIAVGPLSKPRQSEEFQPFERMELFNCLVDKDSRLTPLPQDACAASRHKEEEDAHHAVFDLTKRVAFYFGLLDVFVPALFGLLAWQLHTLDQDPGATARESAGSYDLRREIFGMDQQPPRQRVILLAASGGGTRAALYTASVLHGLQRVNALSDVVLTSGVSGGGCALAYFTIHREELLRREDAWQRYLCAMSDPFIEDVLAGGVEWRVFKGTRLGQLLTESFERRFHAPAGQGKIGQAKTGIILNTALAGDVACRNCSEAGFDRWVNDSNRRGTSDSAGGRLIFTNLSDREAFPARGLKEAPEQRLNYVVIRHPEVTLYAAASLNANFPPVFSNAAVDLRPEARYWVTDGGAVDNRGIESLLFALRHAIRQERSAREAGHTAPPPLPEIHIIVAEASAFNPDFSQDRGIGSKMSAAEKFASELMNELVRQIRNDYREMGAAKGKVGFYYLGMPSVLRSHGGIGTHWMMPSYVRFSSPEKGAPESLNVDRLSVRNIIDQLHLLDAPPATAPPQVVCPEQFEFLRLLPKGRLSSPQEIEKLESWIRADTQHAVTWRRLSQALAGR